MHQFGRENISEGLLLVNYNEKHGTPATDIFVFALYIYTADPKLDN